MIEKHSRYFVLILNIFLGFPGGKESACNEEDDLQSLSWEDLLKEGITTHSSILAWITPWPEEPGKLQFIGSHRVGHN